MNINSLHELAQMIACRDNISFDEAFTLVNDTQHELVEVIEDCTGEMLYEYAADVLECMLGIEPDYLMLFL